MKKKILIIFGTRPEAIKMAPVVAEFARQKNIFDTSVCVTAQHRSMLDQVLEIFAIKPDYDLDIMEEGQDLFHITSRVLLGLKPILGKDKPDLVVVHGDTTTSTAAALAGFYERIPVAHVEAGLRTHDLAAPWPEELNRTITDRIARFLFCPTPAARNNLLRENIPAGQIYVTGNTVIDALNTIINQFKTDPALLEQMHARIAHKGYTISRDKKIILITGHRRENFGAGFQAICRGIHQAARRFPDIDFVYPVHFNPNVQKPVYDLLGDLPNVHLIKPVDYQLFVFIMSCSHLVLTDSGGIQEEAPCLGKPVLVMREQTERPEALEAGTAKLVGADAAAILEGITLLVSNPSAYQAMAKAGNPFGDGTAAMQIVEIITRVFHATLEFPEKKTSDSQTRGERSRSINTDEPG